MRRKQLSKSEVRELCVNIKRLYGKDIIVGKRDSVELVDDKVVLVNKEPFFFFLDDMPVPTLKLLLSRDFLSKVVVDMGAVKFVASGADVMRPGIKEIDKGIRKNEFVVVVDLNNKKPIAVCQTLYSSEELEKISTGKVLINVHHVGDSVWSLA